MFKRIAILGEIGSGNLGDDLGYMLIKKEIEKHFEFVQIDWITPSRFSVLDYMGYDCIATGCGTLLDKAGGVYMMALHRAQERKTPTAILGSGVSDEQHIPPTADGIELFDKVKMNTCFQWIRGEAPDPMWLLGWRYNGADKTDYGINMGFAGYTKGDILQIKNKVEQLAEYFRTLGQNPKKVSCWDNDNVWMGGADLLFTANDSSFEELNKYKYLVAFRGHLGVVAVCCGVNVMAIAYSDKIRQMYEDAGVEVTFLDPSQKNWQNLVEEAMTKKVDNKIAVDKAQKKAQEQIKQFIERI